MSIECRLKTVRPNFSLDVDLSISLKGITAILDLQVQARQRY